MNQVVIENPILNSPFAEPNRHFRFNDEGITDQIEEARRISCYFIPIPKPRKKGKDQQQTFDGWTEDRIEENVTVNAIRQCIRTWRDGRYTARLGTRKNIIVINDEAHHCYRRRVSDEDEKLMSGG